MSKLDQLKALGDAKRAARKSSDGGSRKQPFALADAAREAPAPSDHSGNRKAEPGLNLEHTERPVAPCRQRPPSRVKAEQAPGPSEAKAEIPAIDRAKAVAGNAPAVRHSVDGEAKSKRGRPKIEGPRAWESEGMARRTWYRRQEEKRAKEERK
jgi:hypothetical protein